ncbi:ATP-dependent helicase, partial [Candidatus Beckwithbacteria bacterium CG_4_10_14_0_2_um_filter_47_25]
MFRQRRFNRAGRQPRAFDPSFLIQRAINRPKLQVMAIKNNFADFAVDQRIKLNVKTKGYLIPTPIQDQIIPFIIEGNDVVGIANTGTGKTAAFLIPLIHKVIKNNREKVLVITPTRELAAQIQAEFTDLAKNLGLYSTLCIGGMAMGRQIQRLRQLNHFVIGTPGRLKDLEQRR